MGNISTPLKIAAAAYVPVGISVNGGAALYSVADVQSTIASALGSNATVTVTGELTGAADLLAISIPAGKKMVWNADYSGSYSSLITLLGDGEFELAGGTVSNSFSNGVAFNILGSAATKLTVTGGTINGNQGSAILLQGTNKTVSILGGTVKNSALYQSTINANNSTSNSVIFVNGGTVLNSADNSRRFFFYPGINAMAIEKTGAGTAYAQYASMDLTVYFDTGAATQATAVWDLVGGASGITYENGANTGFIPVSGVTVTDTTAPVPGNSGAITTSNVAQTTLTLNWTAATDDVSAAAALKYYVYQSSSNNISNVVDCGTNGALLNPGGTANIATYSVTGLTSGNTYYFNVVVEDAAGNRAAYAAVNVTTAAPTRVLTVTTPTFASADYGYARPAAKAITISNSGNSAATISNVTVSATDFEIAGSGATVAAGSQISTWTIQPKAGLAAGTHTATITVTYNGTGGTTATANVSFTVNPPIPPIPTYSVTVAPTTNGSVSASPTTAAAGETVTLTVTPATGYKLDAISTTPIVETRLIAFLPDTYEFTMPASNVTVTATFTINTGVEEVQSQAFRAHVKDGLLHVDGLTAGKWWSVYSVSGVLLYQDIAGGDKADVHLPVRGVYIVRSGAHTVKVIY